MERLRLSGSADLSARTGCLKLCRRTEYTLRTALELPEVDTGIALLKHHGETATRRVEVLEYTLSDLISDVGGMLGLFLGMSLWALSNNLMELLESIAAWVKRNTRHIN